MTNNVVIGIGATSEFDNCVVIGPGARSTNSFQIVVGNERIHITRQMTMEEFIIIRDAILVIAGRL